MACDVLSDKFLSRRLERAEALANARFVEARARDKPESGATWIEAAGAYAMYDGVMSPCTQTFGLGMFQMPTVEEMEKIEEFFEKRGAPVYHEVSPLAEKALLPMLSERGYRPFELSNVLFLPLAERVLSPMRNENVRVRVISAEEHDVWARTGAAGWSELAEMADMMLEMMHISGAKADGVNFLAELDGEPIAAGGLSINEGVALFAGASTIPKWRRRGAQQALLESRFQYAAQIGCDLAMMAAEPGSSSQRNAERSGFRIAYTRTKWTLTA